jgi:3D-(3,5/4)-trihydroxycyclohexane-1,2-dione acylhydrolase (decyclizing)
VLYREAPGALRHFANATGVPVGETQAGKGALPFDDAQAVGAIGVTGTTAANRLARSADLVLVVGSRLSDFTTASKTAFAADGVRFININVAELDAYKHAALPLIGDARAALGELQAALGSWRIPSEYEAEIAREKAAWEREVDEVYAPRGGAPLTQGEVIGIVNELSAPDAVLVCAAGSLPGDLHKLWRTRTPGGYHLEYGYSCMGYEIAGGLGIRMAEPDRDVYVMVGDGSYLMMAQEIATAVQERVKLTIIVLDNEGFASIGGLSKAVGCDGFGTRYNRRSDSGELDGPPVGVDFAANAASMGARAVRAVSREAVQQALRDAWAYDGVSVVVVPVDREKSVGGRESWWDVPIAETSPLPEVQRARAKYEKERQRERHYL